MGRSAVAIKNNTGKGISLVLAKLTNSSSGKNKSDKQANITTSEEVLSENVDNSENREVATDNEVTDPNVVSSTPEAMTTIPDDDVKEEIKSVEKNQTDGTAEKENEDADDSSPTSINIEAPSISIKENNENVENESAEPEQTDVTPHHDVKVTEQKEQHDVNVVRHTHHVVEVKDEAEKQRMVNGLVNYDMDRCVSLQLFNDLDSRYRLISSINSHGYTPRGKIFTLKTVFKDPSAHKQVKFHALDENDKHRPVKINGKDEFVATPDMCSHKPLLVHVGSPVRANKNLIGIKKDIIFTGEETKEEEVYKKNHIEHPDELIIHRVGNNVRSITHIRTRAVKKNGIPYPRNFFRDGREGGKHCTRAFNGTAHHPNTCCHFPFKYQGKTYKKCIHNTKQQPWCSLTSNYDKHKKWGMCMPPFSIPDPDDSTTKRKSKCPELCERECFSFCSKECCDFFKKKKKKT